MVLCGGQSGNPYSPHVLDLFWKWQLGDNVPLPWTPQEILKGAKATIVTRRNIEGREAWDVEGLVQAGLKRTVFYFVGGELVEVELQYQKDDWDESKYDGFMGDVRRRLEQRYGQGQLIARKKEPSGEVMQTLVGWKWNQNNTAIELVYFSAQSPSQVFRTLSVHYKSF